MIRENGSLIVRIWDCATRYILKFSILQHIIACLKERYIEKKDPFGESKEEKIERETKKKKLYDIIDWIEIWMLFFAIGMAIYTYFVVKNRCMFPAVQWIIVVIGSYRLIEIMIVQARTGFFDIGEPTAQKGDPIEPQKSVVSNVRDVQRSIFLLLTNIIEILFIFTYLIIATIFFDSGKHAYIETVRWDDLFKCSLYYIFNLKEMNIEIVKNMANNVWFEFLMIVAQLVRIFIVGVAVAKLIGLLSIEKMEQ